jgi:cyclohexanecarboxylate-CoA ligase
METHAILPEARRRAMTASGLWPGRTLLDDFDHWVATAPGRIAIVDHNSMTGASTSLTYASLSQRVDRIAAGLARLGVGRADVVSIQLPNWWQFVALHLAALRLGAITNPIMPIFREREMRFMLRLAETKVLVIPRDYRGFRYEPMADAIRADLPALEHVLVIGGEGGSAFEPLLDAGDRFAERRPGPDDVIELLYTSGTTGEPKGVMHTSNTLYSNVLPYAARLRLDRNDTVLMASPLAHQTGFMYGIVMPIALGGKVVFQDIWNPAKAVDLIAEQQVTFTMAATPFL